VEESRGTAGRFATGCLDFARHDRTTMRTAVALGSNIGDRLENLRAARKAIFDLANVKAPILSSAVYETEPVDCEPSAGTFLNAVIEFQYEGDPVRLLEQLIQIEEALGRKRNHPRNVSRTIDIDLLYCGDQQIDEERLQLPHPRLHLREFVLRPLADIRPDLILRGKTKTIRELLADVERCGEAIRFAEEW
jgi:2-amino-4-hydroxy-6-hydroxymethyldihydropteridine diphosphokinase